MVSCLSTNIVLGVGWYVHSGSSRHKTLNNSAFKLEECGTCMQVELGDDGSHFACHSEKFWTYMRYFMFLV
jgi:hypothetical protein